MEENCKESCGVCRYKHTKRSEKEIKNIESRVNRITGQLNGVKKMVEDNRYCGDILVQISAINHAVKSLASVILSQHLNTCVVEQIKDGNTQCLKEITEFLKHF